METNPRRNNYFNNIGMPTNMPSMFNEQGGLSDAGVAKPVSIINGGPLDLGYYESRMSKARRQVQESVRRFDAQDPEARIAARKRVPKYLRNEEEDEFDKKELKRLEEEKKKKRELDTAKYYEDVMGEVKENNPYYESDIEPLEDILNTAVDAKRWLDYHRKVFNDKIGKLVGSATEGYVDTLGGEIEQQKLLDERAQAYEETLELSKRLETLINYRDKYVTPLAELNPGLQSQLDDYNRLIEQVQEALEDPTRQQLARLYKVDYVAKHTDANWKFWTWFDDIIGSTKVSVDSKTEQERQRNKRLDDRFYKTLADELDKKDTLYPEEFNPVSHAVGKILSDGERDEQAIAYKYNQLNKEVGEYREQVGRKMKSLQDDEVEARKLNDRVERFFNVPESFDIAEQDAQDMPFYSMAYLNFAMPGLIGMSNSSPNQLLGNAITYGGAAASALMTGGASTAMFYGSGIAATPFELEGGKDENRLEIFDKKAKNMKAILSDPSFAGEEDLSNITESLFEKALESSKEAGLSEEYMKKRYTGNKELTKDNIDDQGVLNLLKDYASGFIKSNDPMLRSADLASGKGLRALYENNNMRTMGDLGVQKVIMYSPVGHLMNKAGSFIFRGIDRVEGRLIERSLENKVKADAAGRVTASVAESEAGTQAAKEATKYANGFRRHTVAETFNSGFEAGATVAAATGQGIAATTAAGVAGGVANVGARLAKAALPRKQRVALEWMERRARNKFQGFYDTITGFKEWPKLSLEYGVRGVKGAIVGGLSEGSEEAVQYLNSLLDYASMYGYSGGNLADIIGNDIMQGNQVAKAYFAYLGIGDSPWLNDAEFRQNWKGGFALGAGHVGTIGGLANTVKGMRGLADRISASEMIDNASIIMKEAGKVDRASYKSMAVAAMEGKGSAVLDVLNHLLENDSRREEPNFSQEDYDALKKAAVAINSLAKDKKIRSRLEGMGFNYGTEEYATALAYIYQTERDTQEATQELNLNNADLQAIYGRQSFQDKIKARIDAYLNDNLQGKRLKYEKRKELSRQARENEMKRAKERGEDIESEEVKAKLNLVEAEAFDRSEALVEDIVRSAILNKTRTANKLHGLLKIRAQQNTIEDWYNLVNQFTNFTPMRPDAKAIRDDIDRQIREAKRELHELDNSFDVNMSDGEVLSFIEADPDVIQEDQENARQIESNVAMLQAQKALGNSRLNAFSEDNDHFKRTINAIEKANRENNRLDTMINDILSGDAVNMLERVFENEAAEQRRKDAEARKKAREALHPKESKMPDSVTGETESIKRAEEKIDKAKDALNRNRAEYERKKRRAREAYNRRKNRYSAARRGRLSSTVPFEGVFVGAANVLIKLAEIGAYKFEQFVKDAKEIADDVNIDDALPILKRLYVKAIAKYQVRKPEILGNLSTVDEVLNYAVNIINKTKAYIKPSISTISPAGFMQRILSNQDAKIIKEVSTHYDVFVLEGDDVVIYKHESAILLDEQNPQRNSIFTGLVLQLNEANTSDEAFKNKLAELTAEQQEFPVDEYVKYRNVDGAIEAIARASANWGENESIHVGNIVADLVERLFAGETNLPLVGLPGEYVLLLSLLRDIKQRIEAQGYELVGTNIALYGLTEDGRRVTNILDLLYIDPRTGYLYPIDVRTSYLSITQGWDKPISTKRNIMTTIGEDINNQLHQIEDILTGRFYSSIVDRMGVLPILHTGLRENHVKLDNYIIPILTKYQQHLEENKADILKCEQIINDINSKIDEYNLLVSKLIEYGIEDFQPATHVELVDLSNPEGYKRYAEELAHQYDDAVNRYNDAYEALVDIISEDNEQWEEILFLEPPVEIPQTQYDALVVLEESCRNLDALMLSLPIKPNLTDQDRKVVREIYQAIMDAQTALDDFLLSDKDIQVDVSSELELIASAMEKLAENSDVFGAMSKFVLKWWLTNFSEDSPTNTSQQIRGLFNTYNNYHAKIKGWIDTLYDHVLGDLYRHPKLQEWYSSLFNNYFVRLLDNFEQFLNNNPEADTTNVGRNIIARGKQLIELFNASYNVAPDPELSPDTDELDRIKAMSTLWVDHYGTTDSHCPAYMDMKEGGRGAYVYMSLMPDFITTYLTQDTNIATDPNHTTRFTFFVDRNGKLKLSVQYWDKQNNKERFCYLGFENDINKAQNNPNVSLELLDWLIHYNMSSVRFVNKVKRMLDYVSRNPEYKLTFTVSTDNGSIQYDEARMPHNVFEWMFAGQNNQKDPYTIKLSRDNRLGVAKVVVDQQTGSKAYDVFAGEDLLQRIGGVGENFRKLNSSIASGLLVYFYNTGSGQEIAVPIVPSAIGTEDAKKLVNLMQMYARGQRVDGKGYDILELLKMRIYFADPNDKKTKFNKMSNAVTSFLGSKITIGGQQYDVFTNEQELLTKIAAMSNVTDETALNDNIAFSQNPVFSTARRNMPAGGSITLSNGFTLSSDDFLHQNADGTVGSTWLGHLMRHGLLFTTAVGTGYKQINISGLDLVKRGGPEAPKVGIDNSTRSERVRSRGRDIVNKAKGLGLMMTVDESEIDFNRSLKDRDAFDKAAEEFLTKVLGDGEYSNLDKIVPRGGGRFAVGLTTTSAIELSNLAPRSSIYHETFHKVLELLMSPTRREELYKLYRKHFGENLPEREVAEGMTDLFVAYTEGIPYMWTTFKTTKGFVNKFKAVFSAIHTLVTAASKLGYRDTVTLLQLYREVHRGEFKNNKVSQENIDRFNEKFDGVLYYTVNGVELNTIADSSELNEVIRGLEYAILQDADMLDYNPDADLSINASTFITNVLKKDTIDSLCGVGVAEEDKLPSDEIFSEIFEEQKVLVTDKKGNPTGYNKIYPKFQAIAKKVADALSMRLSDYDGKIKAAPEDEDEDEKVQNQNIDKYDRASYEFRRLDSATKRAKLFFATIPYMYEDEDGSLKLDYERNIFKLPVLMPMMEVYNTVVNDLHHIKSHFELAEALRNKAKESPMYRQLSERFDKLMSEIYTYDDNKNIINVDYDKEALAIQIAQTISSQKINFVVATSLKTPNGKNMYVSDSSLSRDLKSYPKTWWQNLISGGTAVFERVRDANNQPVLKQQYTGKDGADIFSQTAAFFAGLKQVFASPDDSFTYKGNVFNKLSYSDMKLVKLAIVSRLNKIGIMISEDAFDYMLRSKYGTSGADGINSFLNNAEKYSSMQTFIDLLNSFVYSSGILNQLAMNTGYSKSGFVSELAEYVGVYKRITTDQGALGLNGKKYYSITQNNTISYISEQLSSRDKENKLQLRLKRFSYVIDSVTNNGSIIMKAILKGDVPRLTAKTYIGSKTDNYGDSGSEYKEEPTVDDYMAKATMLLKGWLVPPTMADKGMYLVIEGVNIPGIQFISTGERGKEVWSVLNVPTITHIGLKVIIMPPSNVINLFIEYAHTERKAIQECMEDLGYDNIPGYEKQDRHVLRENEKIENYHTPHVDKETKKVVEPNGTRFLSLTEIVVLENGQLVTYNLNDPNKSSTELLALANEKFFSQSESVQQQIIGYTLAARTEDAIEFAIDHGIIERVDLRDESIEVKEQDKNGNTVLVGKKVASKDEKKLINLSSAHLNEHLISVLRDAFMNSITDDKGNLICQNATGKKKLYYENVCTSLAIAAILGDITQRSIISSQEFLRCYIGHPGMFKVSYDFLNGRIKDSSFDIQKRIGGLISTGDDNILRVPGLPQEYTCAECLDYEVGSTSAVANKLEKMFRDGAVAEAFAIAAEKEGISDAWDAAYSFLFGLVLNDKFDEYIESFYKDELTKESIDRIKAAVDKARENAKKFANAYKKGINVADGAAYITADMCKNMLRMRGAYNGKVKAAFDLLTGSESISWMDKAEAYSIIYDEVNIVTTKYTAYGFRDHVMNGDAISDVAVPYYNKFALFPLFDCTATGHMSDIYKKMLSEGVDMMMMQSAVKVGSLGAVEYDGQQIGMPFNKYKQDFGFLRRQLNTDPEEGSSIDAGTQTVKIALSNLRLKRNNYVFEGDKVDGSMLLKIYMNAINKLALIGAQEIRDQFLTNEKIDEEKLSKYLDELLSSRNANKGLVEAIQYDANRKRMKAPLAATPDATWIESIIIAAVNKKVINITTPGSSFVQRSVFATEATRKDGEGHIISDNKLQMINDTDGSMDAKISIDYFDAILPKEKMSFNEKREWLIKNGIIGKNAKALTIAYRIPTQAQSSIHAIRFIDVIPAEKASIILPEEFTKITGSDFDIDHLYLMSYNMVKGEDGLLTHEIDETKNEKEYYLNLILEVLMTLLLDTENSTHSLFKSIDNDTDLAKSVADQIPEQNPSKHKAFNFGTLHEQVERKNDYITGKVGIGPFALNVTNQVLTYLYGVEFRRDGFTEYSGIGRLDNLADNEGNSVMSWMSAYINGHVDIVKDNWVSKLNTNSLTYNTLNLLIRSGFGEAALWFISQPVIKDLHEATERAKSEFLRDPLKTGSQWKVRQYYVREALSKYMAPSMYSDSELAKYKSSGHKTELLRINAVRYIVNNMALLKDIAKNPEKYQPGTSGYAQFRTALANVYYTWVTLERYSQALSDLVQHSKIDTRKHGKSLIEIYRYLTEYNKLFNPSAEAANLSIWNVSSLKNLAKNSWIEQKTKDAILLPFKILGKSTFNGNISFMEAVLNIARQILPDDERINTDFMQLISRHLLTKIKAKWFIDYAKNQLNMTELDINNLFTGNFNIYTRLNGLKYSVLYIDKYKRLANNTLIRQLILQQPKDNVYIGAETVVPPAFVTIADNVDGSRIEEDAVIDAWEDLLRDPDPQVRKFAHDLIIYAFFTSGEFKGWNKLFKYVPPSFLRGELDNYDEPYTEYIRNVLLNSNFTYDDLSADEIVENNSHDRRFAQHLKEYMNDPAGNKVRKIVAQNDLVVIGEGVSESDVNSTPKYITVENSTESSRSRSNNNLYKLVDYYVSPDGIHYPVYAKLPHKGYHFLNNDIFEYGWTFEYRENGMPESRRQDYVTLQARAEEFLNRLFLILTFEDTEFQEKADEMLKYMVYGEDANSISPNSSRASQEHPEVNEPIRMFDDETALNIYQSWEYMEDSINSYPRSDIKTERHIVTSINDVPIERDLGKRMYDFIEKFYNIISRDSSATVSVKYSEYKDITEKIDRFDYIRLNLVDPDYNYYDEKQTYGTYNKNTKMLTISQDVYELYKLMSKNQDVIDTILDIKNKTENHHYYVTAEDLIPTIAEEGVDMFDNVLHETENYSELDLFQDTTLNGILVQNISNAQTSQEKTSFVPNGTNVQLYSEDGGKTPIVMYRGYALTEDREAYNIEETIGKTAVDYDNSLKGAIYFTSSLEEALEYAKTRTDKSPEPPTWENPQGRPVNRHYTGDYAKVSNYFIASNAKVEHYRDIKDYVKNRKESDADVIILNHGTMWSDNKEYVVKNRNVIVYLDYTQQDSQYETEEFYTKLSMLDYVQDRVADGIPREDIKVTHYAETEDTDEYWVVEVKFSQDYKNSADHNNC